VQNQESTKSKNEVLKYSTFNQHISSNVLLLGITCK